MATNHGRHPVARLEPGLSRLPTELSPSAGVAHALCVARTADNDAICPVEHTSIGLVEPAQRKLCAPRMPVGDGDQGHVRVGVHRLVDHDGSHRIPAWLVDATSGGSGNRTCGRTEHRFRDLRLGRDTSHDAPRSNGRTARGRSTYEARS